MLGRNSLISFIIIHLNSSSRRSFLLSGTINSAWIPFNFYKRQNILARSWMRRRSMGVKAGDSEVVWDFLFHIEWIESNMESHIFLKYLWESRDHKRFRIICEKPQLFRCIICNHKNRCDIEESAFIINFSHYYQLIINVPVLRLETILI